jgi:ferredoxin
VTGQAAWYDVRVRITKAAARPGVDSSARVWPKIEFAPTVIRRGRGAMKLGLVIDLDTCVGCHACAVACKEWNGQSAMAGGAPDYDAHGAAPSGVWFNRVRHYEFTARAPGAAASPGVRSSEPLQDHQRADVLHALRGCRLRDRLSRPALRTSAPRTASC